jgi:hypothetical protein
MEFTMKQRNESRGGGRRNASRSREDPGYRRRRAWSRAKSAFGAGDLAEQLFRLERCGLGCPRMLLAAAIHHFLAGGPPASARALGRYLASFGPPAELLSAEQLAELDALELGQSS